MTNIMILAFACIVRVESNDGRYMHGTDGCEGWTQMKEIAVDDCNRISGSHFRYDDRYDKAHCQKMFEILVGHYLPKNPSLEQIALLWCRGTKKSKKRDRPARVVEYLQKIDAARKAIENENPPS